MKAVKNGRKAMFPYSRGLIKISLLMLSASLTFHGCASHKNVRVDETSINYGIPNVVQWGGIIAEESVGEVEVKRKWVGIMNSDDGWSEAVFMYSDDYVERRLYYQGVSDSIVHLIYREYEQGEKEPTLNTNMEFDLNESLYLATTPFYLRVDDIDESSITVTLLDKQTWNLENKKFLAEKARLAREHELQAIILETEKLIAEADDAKTYVSKFVNITPNLSSFSEASSYFNSQRQQYNALRNGNTLSHDDLLQKHNSALVEFIDLRQYFVQVATVFEQWEFIDNDIKRLSRAVGAQQFLEGASVLKQAGETALLAEDFSLATDYFTMARNELNRLLKP